MIGCSEPSNSIKANFSDNEHQYDLVIETLHKDPVCKAKLNKNIRYEALSTTSKRALEELGLDNISYVILSSPRCENIEAYEMEIIFEGRWHLSYDPCGVKNILPGGHLEMNDSFIEMWG